MRLRPRALLPGGLLFATLIPVAAARVGPAHEASVQEAAVEIDDDVKEVPAKDLRAGGDEHKRYFLIGADEARKPPSSGFALLVVMPGGPGGAEFTSFVRRIFREACPDDWVIAQLVSVKWTPDQSVIWPTRFSRVNGMQFTTEEFLAAVVEDVRRKQKLRIDPSRIFQMGWSSSGPAEYAIALHEDRIVTGSYVAQSVFHSDELAGVLKHARGHAFFLDHSPDDETCRFSFSEEAKEKLGKEGAKVELVTYAGGHGWLDDPYARMRKGFAWLEENHGKPARK
jgi:predicted esterase